jgi:hypothetical protein
MMFTPLSLVFMLTPFGQDRRKFRARSAKVLSAAILAWPATANLVAVVLGP